MFEDSPIHLQLKAARLRRKEDIPQLAARIRVREEWLHAIEEGRFAALPRGIYGRAAVRGYAAAVGLDPQAALAACEPLLPAVEDPIGALAVLRGVRTVKKDLSPERGRHGTPDGSRERTTIRARGDDARPSDAGAGGWRAIAAAAIDAAIIMTAMLTLIAITAAFCRIPASQFGSGSAPAFAIMGVLLAASYFLCVGGISGATLGEILAGSSHPADEQGRIDLHAIARRAAHAACRDVFVIRHAGASLAQQAARHRVARPG